MDRKNDFSDEYQGLKGMKCMFSLLFQHSYMRLKMFLIIDISRHGLKSVQLNTLILL
jgi:hypothetical protein